MISTKIQQLFVAALTVGSLAACGQGANQVIKGADLKASTSGGNVSIGLTTHLNSNNIQILGATFPIYNPQDHSVLGQLTVNTTTPGVTDVELSLDFTSVYTLPTLTPETTLPNGTSFPVLGATGKWYSLALGDSKNSKLYVNVDLATNKAVVGYTLSSDTISSGVVANIFATFGTAGTVSGIGGVYSGVYQGQSGFAAFADVSSVLSAVNPTSVNVKSVSKLSFQDHTSAAKQKPVAKHLINLNLKAATLRLK